MKNTDFKRNNLDRALSPYLRQHKDNPVFWQEWSEEALNYAREEGKILFVSAGYSTCHWCHVMASEAFSDPECAAYLNSHFLSIKVDREERPDIDRYMMSFLTETTGSGGWPLNVFLSPQLKPFFAMTYAHPEARFGTPAFSDILRRVREFYEEHGNDLITFRPAERERGGVSGTVSPGDIERFLLRQSDTRYGGMGAGQKFPPHSALLFGLYRMADEGEQAAALPFIRRTLDAMASGGLHDHLQGGFFRYCVDRAWTIPHFEKMLYDQAQLLWVYSLASRLFDSSAYRRAAEGILKALEETFLDGGLFFAAHDADTEHREGATYVWSPGELRNVLSAAEYESLGEVYLLPEEGNFEGSIHLQRRLAESSVPERTGDIEGVEKKLLSLRKKRPQPFTDRKKLTGWNALAGTGLLQAYRHLGNEKALLMAMELREQLIARFVSGDGVVIRGGLDGERIGGRFLEDHAALLLFLTFAYEEDHRHRGLIRQLRQRLQDFRDGEFWSGSIQDDFPALAAEHFDQPLPSDSALADFACARAAILFGEDFREIPFGKPGIQDFRNMSALEAGGYAFFIRTPEILPWESLPVHTVQIEGEHLDWCRKGVCTKGLP